MNHLLTINNLTVELQNKTILSDVELTLAAGDILGLVGPSGCGKTTLLNTIAGFIEQQQGLITLADDMIISAEQKIAPEHRHVGMIFQDYALFPHLTIEQNICFGIDKLAKEEQQKRLLQLLDLLALTNLEKRFPHQLSGGQQQRVAIARALATQPKLLLLDEPFSNIDARLRNELMLEMRQLLKQLNITAIFVTHNKDEVFTFADKIAVMHQGSILQTGAPIQVCQHPNSWQVADFLQLGSWIPVNISQNDANQLEYVTSLGLVDAQGSEHKDLGQSQLLLKNIDIELIEREKANSQVEHIRVTEHGFHYTLTSLNKSAPLAFSKLSLYSNTLLNLGQQVCITIKPHKVLIFPK